MKQNQHVVPYQGKWAVRGERNPSVSSVHATQAEAIQSAKWQAQVRQSEVVIHNRQGQIRDKDSYGPDPFPPRDMRH